MHADVDPEPGNLETPSMVAQLSEGSSPDFGFTQAYSFSLCEVHMTSRCGSRGPWSRGSILRGRRCIVSIVGRSGTMASQSFAFPNPRLACHVLGHRGQQGLRFRREAPQSPSRCDSLSLYPGMRPPLMCCGRSIDGPAAESGAKDIRASWTWRGKFHVFHQGSRVTIAHCFG